ncbi:E3 ubiquitin-protein ligase RNF212B isoform 2-T2 [Morphnus guianensis]
MDWFHCNRCYRQEGARFAVTSCGHVLCTACGGTGPCPVCAADCRYLPISDKMRPQEKLFFKSPADIALKHLTHISQVRRRRRMEDSPPHTRHGASPTTSAPQVWRFQQAQSDLLLASHKEAARRARAALQDVRHVLDTRNSSPPAGEGAAGETPAVGFRRLGGGCGGIGGVTPVFLHAGAARPGRSASPPRRRQVGDSPPQFFRGPPTSLFPPLLLLGVPPKMAPFLPVTPQPRRQLSGQVVSRSTLLEPPLSRGTPVWQVGSAHRGSVTPLASSVGPPPRPRGRRCGSLGPPRRRPPPSSLPRPPLLTGPPPCARPPGA